MLDTVPKPQDPHYPRGLHTSDRARYIQERWDTQLPHFGPLTTGREWVLQGLTHTHPNCLKIHRHQEHYGHDSKKGVYGYMDVEIGCEWGNLILPSASFSLTGTKGYNIILDPYDNLTLFLTL